MLVIAQLFVVNFLAFSLLASDLFALLFLDLHICNTVLSVSLASRLSALAFLLVLLFTSSVSRISALLFLLLAFLFALSVSLLCGFFCLPFSLPHQSLVSVTVCFACFCLASHRSWSNCCWVYTSIAPSQALTAWCHSCSTHYMHTHLGLDVIVVHPQ